MNWPVPFPMEMSTGTISLLSYDSADAEELHASLGDERVWEHMSRTSPVDAAALDDVIGSRLAGGPRATLTIRHGGRAVGAGRDPCAPARHRR